MPIATISSKNQITLPAEIVRELGLKAGDKLAMEVIQDRIVAIREPESWVDYIAGKGHGVYGGTRETVEHYLAEERAWYSTGPAPAPSYQTYEEAEDFEDFYVANQGDLVQGVLDRLAQRPLHAATAEELANETRLPAEQINHVLGETLVPRGWVRRVPIADGVKYRLRRELAQAIALQ